MMQPLAWRKALLLISMGASFGAPSFALAQGLMCKRVHLMTSVSTGKPFLDPDSAKSPEIRELESQIENLLERISGRAGKKQFLSAEMAAIEKQKNPPSKNLFEAFLDSIFPGVSNGKVYKDHEIRLIESEFKRLKELDEKDLAELKSLRARRTAEAKRLRPQAIALLKEALNDPRLVDPITSAFGASNLKYLPKENKVTLLVGNSISRGHEISPEQIQEIRKLVLELVEKKYHVVFDGESAAATLISELAGPLGIPVMSREQGDMKNHPNRSIIPNDFIRMQMLAESHFVVTTPDSINGMGLLMEGLTTHVLDATRRFETHTLQDWVFDLTERGRNLGITDKPVSLVSRSSSLMRSPKDEKAPSLEFPVERFVDFVSFRPEVMPFDAAMSVLQDAISFAKVMQQNEGSGGSVIFGSGKEDPYSAQLIYRTAYELGRLGIAVATGGSVGAMEIANTGAYNAGGVSLGIPIGGKHLLETETNFVIDKHTQTIITKNYEERIPALLGGEGKESRKMILFAPGGNGTIKELATTLVRAAGKLGSFRKIIFLDSDYYSPLFDWLMASALPQQLKDKMVLLDHHEQVVDIARGLQEKFERDRIRPPRNPVLTYELKPVVVTEKSDDKPAGEKVQVIRIQKVKD